MRGIAIGLLVVTLLVAAFLGYCYVGTQMQIAQVTVRRTPAEEVPGTYEGIVQQVENESFLGKLYRETIFTGAEGYAFISLTLRMQNRGLFPMDWIQVDVLPGATDVLQLAQERTPSLAGNTTADYSVTVLARADAGASHQMRISYYVLGKPYTLEYTYVAP